MSQLDMYRVKKKRAVDPNAPPRPNLLSQDKKLRESQAVIEDLQIQLRRQAEEISKLKNDYSNMQQSINNIINVLRRR